MPRQRFRGGVAGLVTMIAALGMAGAVAGTPLPAPGADAPQPTREYTAPGVGRRARRKRGQHTRRPKGEPWQHFKDGSAIDGNGNYRSAKRALRHALERAIGRKVSGRQWNRVRKGYRRLQKAQLAGVARG